jgi:hypothetical protein
MQEINEQSTAILTLSFTDEDGATISPDSITYTLYDKMSGTVRATGTATADASGSAELEFTPEHNEILDQNNRYEIAEAQVVYTYNSKTGRDTYQYKIVNLPKTS